jgi:hypothetical protein
MSHNKWEKCFQEVKKIQKPLSLHIEMTVVRLIGIDIVGFRRE